MIVPDPSDVSVVARSSRAREGTGTLAENPWKSEECRAVPPPPRRTPKKKVNPLHAKRVADVDWKDVTLLRTFISDRGKIRARRVTGLTPQQQRQVATAIRNAADVRLTTPRRPPFVAARGVV
jgi:small subunit ribosomal protein S18